MATIRSKTVDEMTPAERTAILQRVAAELKPLFDAAESEDREAFIDALTEDWCFSRRGCLLGGPGCHCENDE